jgi:hypothetical protein
LEKLAGYHNNKSRKQYTVILPFKTRLHFYEGHWQRSICISFWDNIYWRPLALVETRPKVHATVFFYWNSGYNRSSIGLTLQGN